MIEITDFSSHIIWLEKVIEKRVALPPTHSLMQQTNSTHAYRLDFSEAEKTEIDFVFTF